MFTKRVFGTLSPILSGMAIEEARVSRGTCLFLFLIKRDMNESSIWVPGNSPVKTGFSDEPIDGHKT